MTEFNPKSLSNETREGFAELTRLRAENERLRLLIEEMELVAFDDIQPWDQVLVLRKVAKC